MNILIITKTDADKLQRIENGVYRQIGGQEEIYNSDQASEIIIKSRTNNLRLNDRKRFWNEATTCDMCGAEREDLKHFMLWCPTYTQERRKSERLQQPYTRRR